MLSLPKTIPAPLRTWSSWAGSASTPPLDRPMTPKKTTRNARELLIRRYETGLGQTQLKQRLEEAVESDSLLNASFVSETPQGYLRIGGFEQFGDILIKRRVEGDQRTVSIEFRKGDLPLVKRLEAKVGASLRRLKPTLACDLFRFETLAQFLQFLQRTVLGKRIVIAETAIDTALLCGSEDYAEVAEAFDFLRDSAELRQNYTDQDEGKRRRLREFSIRHRSPFIVLHEDHKLRLAFRLTVPLPHVGARLVLHLAPLPRKRLLLGYVHEERQDF